jgi:uncharacterized protein (DUF169 family)
MNSKIVNSLKCKYSPVAIILTDEKPEAALQFKEHRWGCVAAMIVAASKGRTAVFNRETVGCIGGEVGLGFENQYKDFPIEYLLSTGCNESTTYLGHRVSMTEGERYFKSPELARQFVDSLPMTEIPTDYVVFKPLEDITQKDSPTLILFLVNPDQLSALVVLANYNRARRDTVIVPFGAGCQSILFGYAETIKEEPSAVIGFFDVTVRKLVDKDILSFTIPFKMFEEMETNVEKSFLVKEQWLELSKRIGDDN